MVGTLNKDVSLVLRKIVKVRAKVKNMVEVRFMVRFVSC